MDKGKVKSIYVNESEMAMHVPNTISPGFKKKDRSGFKYWFAHWCAFQMTALNFRAWKPKYLMHDIEKPWLKLFMSYKKVQRLHRTRSRHHLSYKAEYKDGVMQLCIDNLDKMDFQAMLIDWECSRYTKVEAPKTALQELIDLKNREGDFSEEKMHMDDVTHMKLMHYLKFNALYLNSAELFDFVTEDCKGDKEEEEGEES